MPPKNMISVMRKIHMPSMEASFCCSMLSKWCCNMGWCAACSGASWITTVRSDKCRLLLLGVMVRLGGHDRRYIKIVEGWRRRRLPLEAGGAPGIVAGNLAVTKRVQQIDHGQQVSDRENRGAGGGEHVQHLPLGRIRGITARHPHVSQNELREERQVEAD